MTRDAFGVFRHLRQPHQFAKAAARRRAGHQQARVGQAVAADRLAVGIDPQPQPQRIGAQRPCSASERSKGLAAISPAWAGPVVISSRCACSARSAPWRGKIVNLTPCGVRSARRKRAANTCSVPAACCSASNVLTCGARR